MAILRFTKMHGAGNDFVMMDGQQDLPDRLQLARALCDRHQGIGSDGLIIVEPGESVDFNMDFYNPDGSQSFCGNGSRCAFAFAQRIGLAGEEARFKAIDGIHRASAASLGVKVSMQDVPNSALRAEHPFLDTGSPHVVLMVDDLDIADIEVLALPFRHHQEFAPGGTNVNLVQRNEQSIRIRTFERGVEAETLACGTGVTAAALISSEIHDLPSPIAVEARGGSLAVAFQKTALGFEDIWLEGPTAFVFEGQIEWGV